MADKGPTASPLPFARALAMVLTVVVTAACAAADAPTAASTDERIAKLEQTIRALAGEVEKLKADRAAEKQRQNRQQQTLDDIQEDVDELADAKLMDPSFWANKFTIGGYGEMHANFSEGAGADKFDIHRMVLYLGYEFTDWLRFHSETELEHAFVTDGAGGEVSLEQAYLDILLSGALSVRVGRILTPMGIINKKHEPPSFLGVERPAFATYIIPTTWSSDGVGIFGTLAPWLQYEAYVVGGLDVSAFTATGGIRSGRIKERPSLHEPAFTGRVDFYPLAGREVPHGQTLRAGLSTYFGGLDNGNKGVNPGVNGNIHMYSADVEYTISKLDFRAAIAYAKIHGAREIGSGTAEGIFGWYAEAGYHFWPDVWKTGKLKRSDAVVFARYDRFDTQHKMPAGIAKDPAGDRWQCTVGINFYPVPNFVIKADYQISDDASNNDLDGLLNLGVGWEF